MNDRLPLPAAVPTSLAMAAVPAALSYKILGAEGPVGLVVAWCVLLLAAFLARRLAGGASAGARRARAAATIAASLLLLAGAFVIFAGLDITPSSAFLAWFNLLQQGDTGGVLAFLFVVIIAYFGTLFGGTLFGRAPFVGLCGFLVIVLVILAVLTGAWLAAAAALVPLLAVPVYLTIRSAGRVKSLLAVAEVAVLSAVIAAALTPSGWHNRLFDGLFGINLKDPVASVFPSFPFLYTVPGYGHSFGRNSIGDRPALTARPVFEVEAQPGETIYLRAESFDHYTGSGWDELRATVDQADKEAAAIDAGVASNHRDALTVVVQPQANPPLQTSRAMRAKLLIDFYASLPHTLDTTALQVKGWSGAAGTAHSSDGPLSWAGVRTGFVLASPLTRGSVVSVSRGAQVPASLSPQELSADLAVDTTNAVKTLARRLGSGQSTEDRLSSIRAYLASNFAYSLETRAAPTGVDAVDDFLFRTKRGYCVQFATAFVVLARLNGIPARYVDGFLVNIPFDSAKTVVTGLSAHAWAETWGPQNGWTTQEATPPMLQQAGYGEDYYRRFNPTGSSYTLRQLEGIMGGRMGPAEVEQKGRTRDMKAWAVLGAAVLLAVAVLVVGRGLLLLFASPASKTRRGIRRLLRLSASIGLPDPARDGWCAWARFSGTEGRLSSRAARLILEVSFGGRKATRREVRFLDAVRRRLSRHFTSSAPLDRVNRGFGATALPAGKKGPI